jgi:rSAM/selenodomain-associated transferase 2
MRAGLSVIIPTRNAGDTLAACLGALFEGLEAGLIRELVISDAGSDDATLTIADQAGAVVVTGAPSRGGQLARGCAAAQGDWLFVIHADTVLDPGWSAAVGAHMAAYPDRAACCRLRFDTDGVKARIVAGWANLRTRLFDLPFGDQGLLIPRALYDAVGGYPDIPLMEDVVLARALKGRLTRLAVSARTSAARYVQEGWFRRGRRNLWLQLRFFLGASPRRLARGYRRSGRRT